MDVYSYHLGEVFIEQLNVPAGCYINVSTIRYLGTDISLCSGFTCHNIFNNKENPITKIRVYVSYINCRDSTTGLRKLAHLLNHYE
jgi:hypothetical protein